MTLAPHHKPAKKGRKKAEILGRRAEGLAALYLKLKGYRIIARRYRSPVGEIDLIARHHNSLVFIEVKARKTLTSGLEAVPPRQQQRLMRGALHFIMRHPHEAHLPLRFDVIIIRPFKLPKHLIHAFEGAKPGQF
ncbi:MULTISPECIES: YraN family protein [unclassified Iodidimonas]|jgi:putative endonuclease|uniref:YraN family protein n=1 Tax=unclassified Iodidimonas TaxID=2626145 RepID=UPI002482BF91|nr:MULTISPECIES: YraN family protein [unclassified Iodidimonas]